MIAFAFSNDADGQQEPELFADLLDFLAEALSQLVAEATAATP